MDAAYSIILNTLLIGLVLYGLAMVAGILPPMSQLI